MGWWLAGVEERQVVMVAGVRERKGKNKREGVAGHWREGMEVKSFGSGRESEEK